MKANPSVNRYLEDKAFDRIDHALGRPTFPLRETYRNHYATDATGSLAIEFGFSPYWRWLGQQGNMAFFEVTEAGSAALARHLADLPNPWRAYTVRFDDREWIEPARSRDKCRYSAWLKISDTWSELSFADFCRRSSVKVAA